MKDIVNKLPETNDESNTIGKVVEIQTQLAFLIDEFFNQTTGIANFKHNEAFKELLMKVMLNLYSNSSLMTTVLPTDKRCKLSINLLYRSIVDDLINLLYLSCFDIKEEKSRDSIKNELNNLDREYVVSRVKLLESSEEFIRYVSELRGEEVDEVKLAKPMKDIKDKFKHLFKNIENGELLSPDEIRSTSNTELKDIIGKNSKAKSFLSENQKMIFIEKNFPEIKFHLMSSFKYFSQFQHYSPTSTEYIFEPLKRDIWHYYSTLQEVAITIDKMRWHFEFKDVSVIEGKLANIRELLVELNSLMNKGDDK